MHSDVYTKRLHRQFIDIIHTLLCKQSLHVREDMIYICQSPGQIDYSSALGSTNKKWQLPIDVCLCVCVCVCACVCVRE